MPKNRLTVLMCMNMTETGKEIIFNFGKTHIPRRFENCTAVGNSETPQKTPKIFQQFLNGKRGYRENIVNLEFVRSISNCQFIHIFYVSYKYVMHNHSLPLEMFQVT